MRRPALVLAVLMLAACAPDAEPAPASTAPPATSAAPSPAMTATPAPADPLAGCEPEPPTTDLASTVQGVQMPPTVVVESVQEVSSGDDAPGMVDVIAYACGAATEAEHRMLATDIAVGLHESEAGASVHELHVDLYSGGKRTRGLEVDDFQAYTWDRSAAVAPETIWEA